jgi:NitT/TauT family transport system substrate-binding protein
LMRGLEYAVEHPEEAGELLVAADPTQDAELAAAELTLMAPYVLPVAGNPVGVLHPDRVTRAASLLQSTGAMPGTSGLAYEQDIIAWQFVPGADEAEVAR